MSDSAGVCVLDCNEEGSLDGLVLVIIAKSTSTSFDTVDSIQPVFVFYMQEIVST